ncbi:hypothetical protein RhiirB3_427320 [Rhizophagus irregularis]|nr:hypothetical protein RhiirB3_427320 [Rhizophagus irregularis]
MLMYSVRFLSIRVLINIVNRIEQLAGVDQHVYWCESTLFKLADERTKTQDKIFQVGFCVEKPRFVSFGWASDLQEKRNQNSFDVSAIHHLKFHKQSPDHIKQRYGFPVPMSLIRPLTVVTPHNTMLDSPAYIPDKSIPTEESKTWHDKLGILIPNELLPYVTEDPIYVSKRQEKLKG